MDDFENKGADEVNHHMEEPKLDVNQKEPLGPGHNGSWVGAVILIFLGVVFLFKEMGLPMLENWWALFIMIPALACFGSAWNTYHHHDNRFTSGVLGSLIGGIVLTFITSIFLFNLQWSYMWPITLIVIGLLLFFNSFLKK